MNIKKISLISITITAVFFLVASGFYFYTKIEKTKESNITYRLSDENMDNSGNKILIRENILNIVNGETGRYVLYDYSLSPNGKYAYVTSRTPRGYVTYSLLDLENKKDLFDSYTVAGNGELNSGNHVWTDNNKLISVSNFNAEGGEGFDGILVVDLTDQSFYRLVDMTDICPQDFMSNCMGGYSFEIKSLTEKTLRYGVDFDSYSIGQDPVFSYYKEESVSLK